MLMDDGEEPDLFNSRGEVAQQEINVPSTDVLEDLLFLDLERKEQETNRSISEKSSSVSEEELKEKQPIDTEKVSITKDDLWV